MKYGQRVAIGLVSILLFCLLASVILLMIHVKKTNSIILNSDLTCLYREKVYVDRFIKNIDGELIDNYLVDTSVIGKKTLDIQYKNRYGFVEQKRFQIEIKDMKEPTIVINNPFVVHIGDISNLSDIIFCADDYDDGIKCNISGEYNLNKEGDYPLTIEAIDKSGNKNHKDFVLRVVAEDRNKSKEKKEIRFSDIYKKYHNDENMVGIDISKWQGDVDFSKLVQNNVEFVMIKIGGQDGINGNIAMDPYFDTNIKNAINQGLSVGIYFYSHARNVGEARKQARWVVQNIKKYNITLPIAFDWENWDKYATYGIGFRTLNKIADSFIDEVKRYRYEGILYSSKYYLENVWYREEYTNWIAYYVDNFDYDGDFMMWQICDTGKIDGINGFVDIDIMKKN